MSTADFTTAFAHARQLHAQGRWAEAERTFRQLAAQLAPEGVHREAVLRFLLDMYMQAHRHTDAIDTLVTLTQEAPERLQYHTALANLLDALGRAEAAIDVYVRLLRRQPTLAAAHFNLALLYKKAKRYAQALECYQAAVRLGIDNVQEVYSNLGVLYSDMRDVAKAAEMYERAIEIDPRYVPALFNRAGLFEEMGDRQPALELYRRILAIDPRHWDSLARLAQAQRITRADEPLIEKLQAAVVMAKRDPLACEGLYFALGKALDDLGRYEEAFAAYRSGNELGRARNAPYNRQAVERAFDSLIEAFEPGWMRAAASTAVATPIFICGMFRSGSTLIEQILAAHPAVTVGGELDELPWLVARKMTPYPARVRSAPREELQQLGDAYLARLRELFPQADRITDKRPDNFLHIGLIKVLFPRARIVYTKRQLLDNCLSIYFQQLGGNLNYATDLENIAHYYAQHERLMAHWIDCFGEDICTVDYDELVHTPEPVLRRLLEFLGLEWSERCLAFERAPSQVKTASVWQVRQALHPHSSGRWRHYEKFLASSGVL